MKRTVYILFVILATHVGIVHRGYWACPSLTGLEPFLMLPMLAAIPFVFLSFLLGFAKKEKRKSTAKHILVSALIIGSYFVAPNSDSYFIKRMESFQNHEFLELSAYTRKEMKSLGIPSSDFGFTDWETHDKLVSRINGNHPILDFSHFPLRVNGTSANTTMFSWGGGLVGAYGFIVYDGPQEMSLGYSDNPYEEYIHFSDNVVLWIH